jgi:hypothetical protein
MEQTAVEWYAEEFSEHLEEMYDIKITSLTLLEKAKKMEMMKNVKYNQMIEMLKEIYECQHNFDRWGEIEQLIKEVKEI